MMRSLTALSLLSPPGGLDALAAEEKVDTRTVTGSGRGGAILKPDVQEVIEKQKPPEPIAAAPLRRLGQATAKRAGAA